MLSDLKNETTTFGFGLTLGELDIKSVQDWGKIIGFEVNIDNGTDDGLDGTGLEVGGGSVSSAGVDCG